MWQCDMSEKSRVEQAVRQFLPPCQIRCPINEDIQRTNVLISLLPGDEQKARAGVLQIGDHLYEKNPLFTVCGYVCGLCELECNYSAEGGAIRRRLLKRFVADSYLEHLAEKEPFAAPKDKEPVAVIGGGPAGLMAAFELGRRGHPVTIFEASDRLGGALWLIPTYRLPAKTLTETIDHMVRIAGIEVRYNTRVGAQELTMDQLKEEGFKAFFVGKGTPAPRVLSFAGRGLEGQNLSGVMYGHTFLYEVSHGNIVGNYFKDKRVLVIGAGNVAFDVARTARRLGGETHVVCLENADKSSRDAIPADDEEIKGAWEEGVNIVYSRGVSAIKGEGSQFRAIECPRCLSVFDDKGFNPRFDPADTIEIEGDVLVVAVGQGPEREVLQREGLLDGAGRLAVDSLTLQSLNRQEVFVGGDIRRIGFMVEAMRDGLVAAESIDRYLSGHNLAQGRRIDYQKQDLPLRHSYKKEPEVCWIPPEKRMHFKLFERGFEHREAVEEARRCLACGPCASCKACVSVGLQESLPTVEVLEDRCSGCAICVTSCCYGSAQLKLLGEKRSSTTDMFKCKACGICVAACPSAARHLQGDGTESKFSGVLANLSDGEGKK